MTKQSTLFQEYKDNILDASRTTCGKDADGGLVVKCDGEEIAVTSVMTAFPISKPGIMVSLRDEEGYEIAIIDNIGRLDNTSRYIIQQELEKSYFMPTITDFIYSEEKLDVLTMEVDTDKGPRTFQIRNLRKSIRQLGKGRVLIRDVDGNRYEVKHWPSLSPRGRNILMEYL